MTKIAINGFGRIGRLTYRRLLTNHPNLQVVAINDLADEATLRHLLKHDSSYGYFSKPIAAELLAEAEPANLPWQKLGVDIVLECTGRFTDKENAEKHLKAGAKKVIISANAKTEEISHFVLGVNGEKYEPKKDNVAAMGSCTTNCLAPLVKVLNSEFGILRGFMTTVHSYTNTQRILDLAHKNLREARAAAVNVIPTVTGAAKAIERVLPEMKGRLDGLALRVPTPTVSIVDFVCRLKQEVTAEEINYTLNKASQREELRGILGVEDAELVSSDFKGNSFSAIVDSSLTRACGDLAKVLAWYDNEWGYCCRLAEFADYIAQKM